MERLFAKYFKRIVVVSMLFAGLSFVACSIVPPPLPTEGQDPNKKVEKDVTAAKDLNIWNGTKPGENPPEFPKPLHLTECSADTDCGSGIPPNGGAQTCVNLLGTPTCFFPCDPDKGVGDKQNPDCIQPENCIRLNSNEGICIYVPGQLYGIGTYTAVVQHKAGEQCLLRFGGCISGLTCVDNQRHGSVGRCAEECIPPLDSSTPAPTCETPNTVCTRLANGFGACLPK
ncbi:MAG TPA: hypothetical protein DCE42_28850 [Myxococcales bacterium]|nr:hypothetical protein [Deltaproteobacteria bacterium]HAA58806.1 hypothetical protein [Myxococcales bacterium]